METIKNGIIINGVIYELVVQEDSIGHECKDCELIKFCTSLERSEVICNTISTGVGLSKEGSLFKKVNN